MHTLRLEFSSLHRTCHRAIKLQPNITSRWHMLLLAASCNHAEAVGCRFVHIRMFKGLLTVACCTCGWECLLGLHESMQVLIGVCMPVFALCCAVFKSFLAEYCWCIHWPCYLD